MANISIEEFEGKCESLYRLVIAAARRASQLSKPDARPLVTPSSKKTTIVALQEILADKVRVQAGPGNGDEDLIS